LSIFGLWLSIIIDDLYNVLHCYDLTFMDMFYAILGFLVDNLVGKSMLFDYFGISIEWVR